MRTVRQHSKSQHSNVPKGIRGGEGNWKKVVQGIGGGELGGISCAARPSEGLSIWGAGNSQFPLMPGTPFERIDHNNVEGSAPSLCFFARTDGSIVADGVRLYPGLALLQK